LAQKRHARRSTIGAESGFTFAAAFSAPSRWFAASYLRAPEAGRVERCGGRQGGGGGAEVGVMPTHRVPRLGT